MTASTSGLSIPGANTLARLGPLPPAPIQTSASSMASSLFQQLPRTLSFSSVASMSSVSTTFSELSNESLDDADTDAAVRNSNGPVFTGLNECNPLAPFVLEEVRAAVLVDLPRKTINDVWNSTQEIVMEGMLFKKGRARISRFVQPRVWKRRYFKLQSNGELTYYKRHTKRGGLSLADAKVRMCAGTSFRTCIVPKTGGSASTEWRFSIQTQCGEIVLSASTKIEMIRWLTVIRALCEARSSSVDLFMNVEIEVHPMTSADLVVSSPRTRRASRVTPVRHRAKSHYMAPPPKGQIGYNSHHYNTFSARAKNEAPEDFVSDANDTLGSPRSNIVSDVNDTIGSPRPRAQTTVRRAIFTKDKDWYERDGVLRLIKVNEVPATVYQPKYVMQVQVKI